ncbi:hypothetical protein BDM02DRAFT_3109464 [Thelephora ganbajun]|uniref:Uncharacterized protein n=1 Tax=Thelephora ganbajun TaxID=370292 RepID=A0ACB6ZSC0_THEGA|nr:hypothetical protein BDM02DRAFT_3109464 [Thelephora ganbajun]
MANTQLPNELWLRIFEDNTDVLDRHDLSIIVRTCKTFYDLAIKNLYRHVVWKNPISLIHCLDFLRRVRELNEESLVLPRSLTIGVSRMSMNGQSAAVEEDGRVIPARRGRRTPATQMERRDFTSFAVLESGDTAYDFRIPLFASAPLYESMLDLTKLLVSLRELTFTNTVLPDTIHALLHQFPNLRKLHLEMCVIPPAALGANVDHSVLPITELTLRSLYYVIDVLHQPDQELVNLNPTEVFGLAGAQSLETLHIDTTARIFTLFTRPAAPPVPPNLKRLFLHRPKLTKNDCRLSSVGPVTRRVHENASLMLSISLFLTGAPKIESISTCFAFSDANFQMQLVQAQYFETEHLKEFSGPISSLNFPPLTVARNLKAVHFIDDKSAFLLNAQKFADDFEQLEVLSLQITTPWDDEVVLAACSVFPNVLRIRIEYSGPGPNDNFIVSLGPHVLTNMKRLHTFQLFETNGRLPVITDDVWEDDWTNEAMLKTLILPWNKYCRQLREVQLVDGYLWRRAHEKDSWTQRFFPPETDENIWKTSVF